MPEPLRVGFLLDSFAIGGTELNAIKVAEGLQRFPVTLTVFHFQNQGVLRERYEKLGVELIHVPLNGLVSRSARNAIARINSAAHERKLHLLHSHCVYSNIVAAGVRRLSTRSVPLLASRRWTGYSNRAGLHMLNRIAQSAADAVLVNSPSLEQVVRRESPFSRAVYIPNLLSDAYFRNVDVETRTAARLAQNLPATGPVVGMVARLVAVKDHATLLRAWREVVAAVPAAVLAIVGGGPLRGELEATANNLEVSQSVRFLGEAAPDALPHSLFDVSVLTSLDEGFPNSLLEAMAQRRPVISTDVGGVKDLVKNGVNGVVVPKANAREISAAIISMISGKTNSALLVAGGEATAATHRESVVLPSLTALYQSLIRRS